MQMREKNEQKRNVMWKVVITISTLVILLVLGYILNGIFTGNPIKGEWQSEEKGYVLEIKDDDKMTVKGKFDDQDMEFELKYSLNKANKLITIKADAEEYDYMTSAWTTDETSDMARTTSVTFSYSLGRKTLTLTDRDYGEEFIFIRK